MLRPKLCDRTELRARHDRGCPVSTRPVTRRRQAGARRVRRRADVVGRGRPAARGDRAQARPRRSAGALHRGSPSARAGTPWPILDDPLSRADDRRRLRRRQRLRRPARRSGVQDGGRPPARDGRRAVLAAYHVSPREPADRDRAHADDGGDDRHVLRQLRRGAAAHPARHRRHRGPGARRPAAGALQRPSRQPLLSADPHLRGDDGQAGGDDPQARQDARRYRGRPRPAPRRARDPSTAGRPSTSSSAATATMRGTRR